MQYAKLFNMDVKKKKENGRHKRYWHDNRFLQFHINNQPIAPTLQSMNEVYRPLNLLFMVSFVNDISNCTISFIGNLFLTTVHMIREQN